MARLTRVFCDACGREAEPVHEVIVRIGGHVTDKIDLCPTCASGGRDLTSLPPQQWPRYLSLADVRPVLEAKDEQIRRLSTGNGRTAAEDQLANVKRLTNDALRLYRDGASIDKLAERLRDIASNANRQL